MILVNAALVKKSETTSLSSSANRHEKIGHYVPSHLAVLAMEVEGKIPSWVEQEVRELKHCCTRNIRQWTGCVEAVLSHGISLSTDTLILPLLPFSIASQARYVTHSIKRNESMVKSLCQQDFDLEQWQSVLTTNDARQGAINVLEAITVLLAKVKKTLADITRNCERLEKEKCCSHWTTAYFSLGVCRLLSKMEKPRLRRSDH